MLSAFFLGESELLRALGKAARLINRPVATCVVPGVLTLAGNKARALSIVSIEVGP